MKAAASIPVRYGVSHDVGYPMVLDLNMFELSVIMAMLKWAFIKDDVLSS